MATAAPTDNRVHLYRLLTLNIDCSTAIVRNLIDDKCSNTALTTLLAKEKRAIINLRTNKAITKVQFDLLYPQTGIPPTTADFDLTLAICLLGSLKHFGLNSMFKWNVIPQPGDTSLEADLCRLRMYRNEFAHISSTKGIQETDFKAKWADIEGVLHRLNNIVQNPVQNLQQIIDDCKTGPLDPEAEKEIEKQIDTMQKMEEQLENEVENIKKSVADVTEDVNTISKDVNKLNEDVDSTNKRMDKLEKQKESEGTPKAVGDETPDLFQRISGWFTYRKQKKDLKEDLITLYRQQYHTLPLSPLMEEKDTPLLKFYVMPDIKSVDIQNLLGGGGEHKSEVTSLHDVFYKESKPCREIYLTADAGFGKTAFSKRLVLTWCQAKKCIQKEEIFFEKNVISAMAEFEFVFLLSLRDCSEECDIDEMIINKIISRLAHTSITISDLETIFSKEKCLVILDGLDEWTHPAPACKRGKSDIPHRKARECTILTTTRPWKLGVCKIRSTEIERKLELVGLSETSAKSLKRSVISLLPRKIDIEKYIQDFDLAVSERGISDLEAFPLLLVYLLCLWCDGVNLGTSRTALYCQIVELLLKRTFEKYPDMQQSLELSQSDIPQCFSGHEQSLELSQSDIPQCFSGYEHCKKHDTYLKSLGQLAFETLSSESKENTLVFSQSMVEKHLIPNYLKLSLDSGILTQSTEKTLTKQISKFSFSHKTVQEFFCALFICCQNESDIKSIVQKNCKSLQKILDMSTVFVFISGLNAEIISSISRELMSVISEDNVTREYRRSSFVRNCEPLKEIQDMYISCIKENKSDKELFCQDFFFSYGCKEGRYFSHLTRLAIHNKSNMQSININTFSDPSLREIIDSCSLNELFNINKIYYFGKDEQAQLRVLLNRSTKCVAVISSGVFSGSWSREICETLKKNSLLQTIYIEWFAMSHNVLNDFLNYITNSKTMTEIRLWNLFCTEHGRSCTFSFDFCQHPNLRKLELWGIPEVSQLKVNSQVKHVWLWRINLGEMSLPPEMVNIELVWLRRVNMSASTFDDLVKVVEKLLHKVTVKIDNCKIEPRTEFEDVKHYIHSSQTFRVTPDRLGRFVFETNVESKVIQ